MDAKEALKFFLSKKAFDKTKKCKIFFTKEKIFLQIH